MGERELSRLFTRIGQQRILRNRPQGPGGNKKSDEQKAKKSFQMVRENSVGQCLQSLAGGIAEMDEASKVGWVKILVPRAEDGRSKPDLAYLQKA